MACLTNGNERELRFLHLSKGTPDESLLEKTRNLLSVATKALFASDDVKYLEYGPSLGDLEARKQLATFLSNEFRDEVKYDNLMFTAGATPGLMYLVVQMLCAGDLAIVEDPTYHRPFTILSQELSLNVVPVSSSDDGVDVEELDQVLTEYLDENKKVLTPRKPYSALVYLVPVFSNPKGSLLSDEKSKQLIKVLRKHRALAVCDDVYNVISFLDEKVTPPKRLVAYDVQTDPDYQGNVISCGSFSKFLGPGLRLGWIESPVVSRLSSLDSLGGGGCPNHFTACVLREAFKLGLVSKHATMVRNVLQSRMQALCGAIDRFMPTATYVRPKGGYYIWLVLPEAVNAEQVLAVGDEKYNIKFYPGNKFSFRGKNFQNCIRLSFANSTEEGLWEGIQRLAKAVNELSSLK